MQQVNSPIGRMVRSWRERRRVSQLALAAEAQVSQRHLSFIESGRASPSREMVTRLANSLDVPLREQNALLLAAGYAPVYRDRPLDDPALQHARASVERLIRLQEPFPALALDRGWNVVAANAAVPLLLAGVDPELLKPPQNVIRLSLHPRGLAPLIVNFGEWRAHLIERLRRQLRLSGDPAIGSLIAEAEAYPARTTHRERSAELVRPDDVAVLLKLRSQAGVLSFLSTVTVFGTAVDVTLAELSIECFYPADDETGRTLRAFSGAG
ncbi:helix-turn-helix domain-containing protein [Roseiarcus sp.]|uniref:helix-turn-helix domain-containing protein n=1 Tax=Roseiarcus sp. TaxID=1969460 RepID=UPI003F95A6B2